MYRRTMTVALGLLGTTALASAQTTPPDAHPRTADETAAWTPHRSIKVLYAGKQGGHREQAFAEFLDAWFDESKTIPLEELSTESAAGHDVVIADWVSQYGNDGYPKREDRLFSAPAKLGPEFTKPIIAMTYVGTQIRPNHKLDWL